MEAAAFEKLAYSLWKQMPEHFRSQIDNVALLIADEPDDAVRTREGLTEHDILLGLYEGIPLTHRGESYGVGIVLPDTITLYRLPIIREAEVLVAEGVVPKEDAIAHVLKETIWHEVGHYFGLTDEELHVREEAGTNVFKENKDADR